ncbi:MAG: BON domain-containing protein [Alkalimonas sp.]|nr:BON domain-containing protein [Alkalimonas sp.]
MKLHHNLYAVLLTLPLFVLTACDRNTASAPMSPAQDRDSSQSYQVDDSSLNRDVTNALQLEASLNRRSINVDADEGHITLSGTVASLQEKNRATEIAKKVSGVIQVHNNLEIVMTTSSY